MIEISAKLTTREKWHEIQIRRLEFVIIHKKKVKMTCG